MKVLKISQLVIILTITLFPQNKWLSKQPFQIANFLYPAQNRSDLIVQRMDSIISNSVTGDRLKMLFEYDNNDNIIEERMTGRMSGWDQNSKIEFLYDQDNKLIQKLDMDWNGTEWIISTRYTYLYNVQGQLNQLIIQQRFSNELENFRRVSYEYDNLGNQSKILYEGWQNDWQNESLITFYYSNINRKDSILFQDWDSIEWENNGKTLIYYNQQTQFMELVLFKLWTGEYWENALKRVIECDQNGNQTLQTDLIWNGAYWENSIRRFYTYDNLSYTLTSYCELWNSVEWYPGDGDLFIENPDGFSFLFFDMNNVYIYYNTTGISDENNSVLQNFVLAQNYPNPFNPSTTIKFALPVDSRVKINVYNSLGQLVETLVDGEMQSGYHEVNFNASRLASGVYLYQLLAQDYVSVKKMLLIK